MQLKPSIYSVLNPTFAFGIFAAWLLVSTQAASRNPFLTLSADSHAEFGNLRSVDAKPPAVHDQPLIGILSQPGDGDGGRAPRVNSKEDLNVSYIAASYVKWVESAGARPVPILYDDPDWLMEKVCALALHKAAINGLILPGGGTDLVPGPFFSAVEKLLKPASDAGGFSILHRAGHGHVHAWARACMGTCMGMGALRAMALAANDAGDYFPVQGTCMGMETLTIFFSQDFDILETKAFNAEDSPEALKFTSEEAKRRAYFSWMTPDLLDRIQKEKITMENHESPANPCSKVPSHLSCSKVPSHLSCSKVPSHLSCSKDGTTVGRFLSNKRLKEFFHILTTSVDRNGTEYVTTIEARDYPIYGTQWHPEKTAFEWGLPHIPHSAHAVAVCQATANFFVNEARRSTHRPESDEEMDEMLIYNRAPMLCHIIEARRSTHRPESDEEMDEMLIYNRAPMLCHIIEARRSTHRPESDEEMDEMLIYNRAPMLCHIIEARRSTHRPESDEEMDEMLIYNRAPMLCHIIEARRSTHRPESDEEMDEMLIYNRAPMLCHIIEARRSTHRPESDEEMDEMLIYNRAPMLCHIM
ncbi:unnamed protein product [Closterium sp. NIES-64]|nr:unnamed protein product [Closterium sp. NIES-64]